MWGNVLPTSIHCSAYTLPSLLSVWTVYNYDEVDVNGD